MPRLTTHGDLWQNKSDSSYKSNDGDCLAIRSGVICLTNKTGLVVGDNQVQLLDFISKKQSRVCRSTYAAEMYSALDLIGLAVNINLGLTEVLSGIRSATELSSMQEHGENVIKLDLCDRRAVCVG